MPQPLLAPPSFFANGYPELPDSNERTANEARKQMQIKTIAAVRLQAAARGMLVRRQQLLAVLRAEKSTADSLEMKSAMGDRHRTEIRSLALQNTLATTVFEAAVRDPVTLTDSLSAGEINERPAPPLVIGSDALHQHLEAKVKSFWYHLES